MPIKLLALGGGGSWAFRRGGGGSANYFFFMGVRIFSDLTFFGDVSDRSFGSLFFRVFRAPFRINYI